MEEKLKPIKLVNEEAVVCKAVREDKKEYYIYLGANNSVQIFEDENDIWPSYIMLKEKVIENQITIAKFIVEWNKKFESGKALTKVVIIPITHVVLSTKRNVVIGKGALLSIEKSMNKKESDENE